MRIKGEIELDTPQGKVTLEAKEFQIEEFTNGPEIELNWDTGDWSVRKIFGGKFGAGDGDWEVENCSIISENVHIEYTS